MNSACFVTILGEHLSRLSATAQQLTEARQLRQSTREAEAALHQDLAAYAWAVRHRALLLLPMYLKDSQNAVADNAELHIRLSVIEALLALRFNRQPKPQEPMDQHSPINHAVMQRLASAESRLFHLFGIIPLN